MKVRALSTIIEFDGGQMVVINAGDTGELSDDKAKAHIEAGKAEAVKAGKSKATSEPEPEPEPGSDAAPV